MPSRGVMRLNVTSLVGVALTAVCLTLWNGTVRASEFPERECCDPVYPPPVPTAPSSSAATPTGRSGPNIKTAIAILNCLLARQLCFEDASCSAILEIIPRVCGPELVACSTVTVTKCQAALRTLQAFPFFKPTCLCREPHVDPECNSFRDFLFDHPCVFVLKKEKDPYPVDALPTCNHALSVCQQERKCIKLFEDFKSNCKVREGKCRMDDRDLCHESWTNLRLSPMFGCICPNNHMKRRCDRIFSLVNHNPCVVKVISPSENFTGASFDYGLGIGTESQVENPLVDAESEDVHAAILKDHISVTMLKNRLSHIHGPSNISQYDEELEPKPFSHHHQGHRKVHSMNSDDRSGNHELTKLIFQSTCHLALDNCNNNYSCRMALHPVLHHCDMSRCNRNSCMEALQAFYRRQDLTWSLEIAFCLCKKTDNKHDPCMLAQEKLHPVCAQRVEGAPTPTCHSLAETCREDNECRSRLEHYEQSCAVDSVTKKCAGPPSECRTAMLGILGTELRTTCACKGTDLTQLYDCLGWQRLLWVNPCVVESQKNYHMNRTEQMQTTTPTTPATTKATTIELRTTRTTTVTVGHVTFSTVTEPTIQETTTVIYIPPPAPTVTTTTTTTVPPRFCVFQRPHQSNQYIQEGKTKRMYHEDEVECSEICHCGIGEALVCHTICVDRKPCKTEFALYNHAAPAYQAFRGRCLCYSGRFICMKPTPGDYSLPQGVFLFLGYSETDETLLKPHSNLSVHDAVASLQEFLLREADNGTLCTLSLFNVTKENVILVAKLSGDYETNEVTPASLLIREKEECASLLETISEKINSQHSDFNSHLLLSIFKMAEVEINQLEPSSSCNLHSNKWLTSIFVLTTTSSIALQLLSKCTHFLLIS